MDANAAEHVEDAAAGMDNAVENLGEVGVMDHPPDDPRWNVVFAEMAHIKESFKNLLELMEARMGGVGGNASGINAETVREATRAWNQECFRRHTLLRCGFQPVFSMDLKAAARVAKLQEIVKQICVVDQVVADTLATMSGWKLTTFRPNTAIPGVGKGSGQEGAETYSVAEVATCLRTMVSAITAVLGYQYPTPWDIRFTQFVKAMEAGATTLEQFVLRFAPQGSSQGSGVAASMIIAAIEEDFNSYGSSLGEVTDSMKMRNPGGMPPVNLDGSLPVPDVPIFEMTRLTNAIAPTGVLAQMVTQQALAQQARFSDNISKVAGKRSVPPQWQQGKLAGGPANQRSFYPVAPPIRNGIGGNEQGPGDGNRNQGNNKPAYVTQMGKPCRGICNYFSTGTICPFGLACSFAHM